MNDYVLDLELISLDVLYRIRVKRYLCNTQYKRNVIGDKTYFAALERGEEDLWLITGLALPLDYSITIPNTFEPLTKHLDYLEQISQALAARYAYHSNFYHHIRKEVLSSTSIVSGHRSVDLRAEGWKKPASGDVGCYLDLPKDATQEDVANLLDSYSNHEWWLLGGHSDHDLECMGDFTRPSQTPLSKYYRPLKTEGQTFWYSCYDGGPKYKDE